MQTGNCTPEGAARHRKGPPSQRSAIAKRQGGIYRPNEFELNGRVYKGLKNLMLIFDCKEVINGWT